ncbi:SPOR domain-containing protein [Candidatus Saganbacteria bacterium]|nr:SPOR domain-containing protein [Candidatus Saganbacteria bacterium]
MPGWLRNILLIILLIGIVIASFWVSFLIGQKMLTPTKKLPTKYMIPEEAPTIPPSITLEVETVGKKIKPAKRAMGTRPRAKVMAEPKVETTLGGAWVVQIGAFSKSANAAILVKQLKAKGFSARQTKVGALFRVYAGGFSTAAEAKQYQSRLLGAGFEGIVRRDD